MGEAAPCGEALDAQARPPPLPPAGPDGGGGRREGSSLLSSPTQGLCRGLYFFHTEDMWGEALSTRRLGATH